MNDLPIWGELKDRVNNPLQIIAGGIHLLMEDYGADDRLLVMQAAVFRAATAVDEIAAMLELEEKE